MDLHQISFILLVIISNFLIEKLLDFLFQQFFLSIFI